MRKLPLVLNQELNILASSIVELDLFQIFQTLLLCFIKLAMSDLMPTDHPYYLP